MTTPEYAAAAPRTMKEYVIAELRREILTGELPGGTRLVQSTLAQRLKVSTTPVREALTDLAGDGFVRLDPHRGAMVNETSTSDLREVFEIRRVLEPMVIRSAIPNATSQDIAELEKLCDEMEGTKTPRDWVQLNRAFHGVFMRISHRPRLGTMVGSLQDAASPFVAIAMRFRPEMMSEGNADHRILIEATRDQDQERAAQCIMDHMDITVRAIEDHVGGG